MANYTTFLMHKTVMLWTTLWVDGNNTIDLVVFLLRINETSI